MADPIIVRLHICFSDESEVLVKSEFRSRALGGLLAEDAVIVGLTVRTSR